MARAGISTNRPRKADARKQERDELEKQWIRACIYATQEIPIASGFVTCSAWKALVRSKLQGFQIGDSRLDSWFQNHHAKDIRTRMKQEFQEVRIEWRGGELVVRAYLLVPIDRARLMGTVRHDGDRAYYDE